ncbi:MAG TPA: HEAT repeat domain-containing protein [Candidatus Solibacter sp.]|nr:HEAT repeat domain-containing protein [Candidatus Solibacter sp.]
MPPPPPVTSGDQIPVPGRSVPADYGKLSEHNLEWVMQQPAQVQAEFLLGAAINHDRGATDMINKMVDDWHGKVHYSQKFDDLSMTALYSNDLRVRAAAIEITLAVDNLPKTEETAEKLMASAEKSPSYRPFAMWVLGMLANRGVEPEKIHDYLRFYLHNANEKTRHWTVEGLAHLGTDDTIKDFLDVFRNDPSLEVRERAGCSLAKSGMLTREQRMLAVPGLIELADDPSLDATTRSWVYQALREITNEHLGNDPAAWRNWNSTAGAKRREEFRLGESWSVLGNN